jgi:ABC-2 type transport system ATP-binding protein
MKKLIQAHNLSYSIPYGKDIFSNVSFDVSPGEFLGVLGRNGTGKTTLIDLMLGIRTPKSGELKVMDENPCAYERQNLNTICYIAHDSHVRESLSVREFLDFYADMYASYFKEDELFLLKHFSINSNDKVGSLSTGQKKKVQTIAALSTRPQLLLIDEVTAVLDPESREHFFSALHMWKDKHNISVVLATNIAEDLINRADKILFIDNGHVSLKPADQILELFSMKKVA